MSADTRINAQQPWPWLDAYTEDAQAFFHGRGEATGQLLRCVLAAATTVLFGKSGLGKTSLLQAGLSPLLRQQHRLLPVLVRLDHRSELRPSLSAQLLARLQAEAAQQGLALHRPALYAPQAASDTARLWELLHDTEAQWRGQDEQRWTPVFILDQFEEVFTLVPDSAAQQCLFDELGDLIQGRIPAEVAQRLDTHDALLDRINPERLGARFVLSLREDFLPDLEIHADRIPRLGPNRYRLRPMSHAEALDAVAKTGRALVTAQDARRIVDFLDQQQGGHAKSAARASIEPTLLSLVCAGLNQHRIEYHAELLSTDTLDTLGSELLEGFYDRALAPLPEERRAAVAQWVETELITANGTRRPYPEAALVAAGISGQELRQLTDHRLLRTEHTEQGAYVELVHDRIAHVAAKRAELARLRAQEQAERAEQERRRAEEARLQAQEAEHKRRQQRWLLKGAGLILVVLLIGLVGTYLQWRKSQRLFSDATAQRVLSEANDLFGGEENRPSTAIQSLMMTMAGHRLAQGSATPYVQTTGYAAVQREAIRLAPLLWLRKNQGGIRAVAFSPDGTRIVSGSRDKTLQLWDARTGSPIGQPLAGHTETIWSVAFSPDGTRIVSGSTDRTLRLWDARTGSPIGQPLAGHTYKVNSVAFSPDGTRIVSGSTDRTLRLWDARTGSPIGQPLAGHTGPVSSVAFSPDGMRIVSGSIDETLRLWDARTGNPISRPLAGHTDPVTSVAFSPDGTGIVSGSIDETLRLWDARADSPIDQPLAGHTSPVSSVAFSPDGARIISGSNDKTLRLWDARTSSPIGQPLTAHREAALSVAFSPDGTRIVSGSRDSTLRLWDTKTGSPIGQPLAGHTERVTSVAFSPDGTRIVSGSFDNTLRLWDARTGSPIGQPLAGHTEWVTSVAFSPDGTRIVSGSWDKTLRLWDARTGHPIGQPLAGHPFSVDSVAFSPDGMRIVSGSTTTLRLWDAKTGSPIGQPLDGHTNRVDSVAFSPDGTRIISGSADRTLRLWDARTGRPIGQPLTGHTGSVNSVAFSPDGRHIVSGSDDNTLRLWPVLEAWADQLCAKLPRNMSHQEWREWISPDIAYIEQCPGKPIPAD